MAERWFLKVDGIPGESTDDRHRGEIDVTAWSFGVTHPAAGAVGAGAGAAKASFGDLQVEAPLNATTPLLFRACASGQHVRTAVLTGVRVGAGQPDFVTYSLEDVTVSSVGHGDGADGVPTDRVALRYGTVRISYVPQRPDGSPGATVAAGWDVIANRPL